MALLNFYKGNFATLPAQRTEGNVYITADEKAMYVDIGTGTEESQRIRLGQIVNFATFNSFTSFLKTSNPPYSQEAFYYIADKNALLRWVSSTGTTGSGDNEISGQWVQINSTSDVQADLTQLTSRVAENETGIADLVNRVTKLEGKVGEAATDTTEATGLYKSVADAQSVADQGVKDAEAAKKAADKAQAAADKAQAAADKAQATADTNVSAIGNNTTAINENKTAIEGVTTRVSSLETTVGGTDDQGNSTGLVKDVAGLKAAIGESGSGLTQEVANLTAEVSENTTAISNNATAIQTNTNNISNNNKAIQANADEISTLKGTVESQATSLTGLTNRAETAETNIANLTETVNGHGSAISSLQQSITDTLTSAKSYTDDEIGKVNQTISSINTQVTTNKGNIESLQTNMTQAQNDISANTSAISNLTTSVGAQIADAKKELQGDIAESIKAANAMEYKGNIAAYNELPAASAGVKIGDTYVVSTKFTNNDITYHAGDMLIAKGTEDDSIDENGNQSATYGYIIAETLSWDHVITGYVKEQDDKFDVKNNALLLKNYLGDINGRLTFKTVSENEAGLVVTLSDAVENASGTPESTITFAMQWGTF